MTPVRLRVPLVTIVAAAVALYVFAQWTERQGLEDQGIIRGAEQALATGQAWRARQAKLTAIARAAVQTGRGWKAKAEAAAPAAARLAATLTLATTARDSNVVLVHQVAFYQSQAVAWEASSRGFERAWLADSTRAGAADARIAELEQHLAQMLTVADCRMLGVRFLPRCPSRTTSAVLGAAGTAIVFVATRH